MPPIDVVQPMDGDLGARHRVEKGDEFRMVSKIHRSLRQHACKIEAALKPGQVPPEPIGNRRYSSPIRRDEQRELKLPVSFQKPQQST